MLKEKFTNDLVGSDEEKKIRLSYSKPMCRYEIPYILHVKGILLEYSL